MRARIALSLLALCAGAGSAAAAPRYFSNITARPIFRATWVSTVAAPTIYTTDLRAPPGSFAPDTFLVIKKGALTWFNDNCAAPSGTLSSCVTATGGGTGTYTITVFAAYSLGYGTADVVANTTLLANDAAFGGAILNVAMQSGVTYAFQTAHVPAGATDTQLILYDASWVEKGYDDDSGIEEAARFVATKQTGDRLVVGAFSGSTAGATAVIANECLYDPDSSPTLASDCFNRGIDGDRDNLSDGLEAELGTSPFAPGGHDTDRDGLYDYYEVIGRRLGSSEQELRRLGADPRRRDIFLELDAKNVVTGPTPESNIQSIRDRFLDLPRLPANPDGSLGIVVHADTGAPCPSDSTLCGDWGGHSVHLEGGQYSITYANIINDGRMSAARQSMFHYVYVTTPCPGIGGRGKAPGAAVFVCSASGGGVDRLISHELGHNLGLSHWGGPGSTGSLASAGTTGMNYKAAYPSVMNYAYQNKFPDGPPRFSEGRLSPLDHRTLDESSYSPGIDKDYLTGMPYMYAFLGADSIDFNRDGRFSLSAVRSDFGPLERRASGNWPVQTGAQAVGTAVPSGGAALAVSTSTLYAFAPFSPSKLRFARTAATEGSWSAWSDLVLPWTPDPAGETAASLHTISGAARIVVVHPRSSDHSLQYALFNPATDAVVGAGAIPGWPAGTLARQATLAAVAGQLAVAYRDQSGTNDVWYKTMNSTGTWASWVRLTTSTPGPGTPLKSYLTPGIVQGPDGYEYVAAVDPITRDIGFYRRSAGSNADLVKLAFPQINKSGIPDAVPEAERTRLNLLFLPYLTATGATFSDGSGFLALFYNNLDKNDWFRAYTAGYLTPSGATFGSTPSYWRGQAAIPGAWKVYSLGVARRGNEAAAFYSSFADGVPGVTWHVPHANAIPPTTTGLNEDHDDAARMNNGMCDVWRISCRARCDSPTAVCSPGGEGTEIECETTE